MLLLVGYTVLNDNIRMDSSMGCCKFHRDQLLNMFDCRGQCCLMGCIAPAPPTPDPQSPPHLMSLEDALQFFPYCFSGVLCNSTLEMTVLIRNIRVLATDASECFLN